MRIVAKRTLRDYWGKHPDCEQALLSWYKTSIRAKWSNFNEIRNQFGTCKVLGNDRIIFKIKGNQYRLVVKISFTNQLIFIRFIGTHTEYDLINAKEI
ncbi:MAG: mRNA interferase HigB [Saprospiraceae bacterium]|jgi:mRNA interferase HigB